MTRTTRTTLQFRICPLVVFALSLFSGAAGRAQNAPPGLAIGDAALDFDLPGVDGKRYSLESFSGARVLVIVFTCNHCPTAQAYENRLIALAKEYEKKSVSLVAISPNDDLAVRLDELGYTDLSDSFEEMKIRANDKKFPFPYLYDGETQKTSRAYGPKATPHVFVFDRERKLCYSGRVDDSESGKKIRHRDTRNAIEAVLAGESVPVETTRVFGCSIKWSDKREANRKFMKRLAAEDVAIEKLDLEGVKALRQNDSEKLRLINVWATWCGPCRTEFPDLVKANRMYRHRDFEFVSISVDSFDKQGKALEFLEKVEASNRNAIYGSEELDSLAEALDEKWSGALPLTILVEPKGKIRYRREGEIDPLELRRAVVDYLGRTYD